MSAFCLKGCALNPRRSEELYLGRLLDRLENRGAEDDVFDNPAEGLTALEFAAVEVQMQRRTRAIRKTSSRAPVAYENVENWLGVRFDGGPEAKAFEHPDAGVSERRGSPVKGEFAHPGNRLCIDDCDRKASARKRQGAKPAREPAADNDDVCFAFAGHAGEIGPIANMGPAQPRRCGDWRAAAATILARKNA